MNDLPVCSQFLNLNKEFTVYDHLEVRKQALRAIPSVECILCSVGSSRKLEWLDRSAHPNLPGPDCGEGLETTTGQERGTRAAPDLDVQPPSSRTRNQGSLETWEVLGRGQGNRGSSLRLLVLPES